MRESKQYERQLGKEKVVIEVVEAEGVGPIINNDVIKARKTSLADAQKRASELVIGVYISAQSWVSKSELIEDNITTQTEAYIEKYDIIKEWKDENFYRTKIRVHVRKEDLLKKIADLDNQLTPKKYGNPKISFWITERIDNEETMSNTAELELMKSFVDAGFVVSDVKPKEFYANRSSLLNDEAANLKKLKADIVVFGDAASNFNTDKGIGGFVSYRSNISLKILMSATKDIITTINKTASGMDVTNENAAKVSITNVAKKSAKDLPQSVLKYLKERAYATLFIQGVYSIIDLNNLISKIRAYGLVKDSWVRIYANQEAVVSLDLRKGTIGDIVKLLENSDNWNCKVLQIGQYENRVKVTKK
ncbi:MAG: hypothetical protein AB1349_05880 [Elusimicrobiota bacterium]